MSNAQPKTASKSSSSRLKVITDSTRAEYRKLRQLAIEKEQKQEEAEALRELKGESHHQFLIHSLSSVKTEFADLDGIKWTRSMLRRRQWSTPIVKSNCPSPSTAHQSQLHKFPSPPREQEFSDFGLVKDSSNIAEFDRLPQDDTIRVSAARWRYRGRIPSSGSSPLGPASSESRHGHGHVNSATTSPRRSEFRIGSSPSSAQNFDEDSETNDQQSDEDTIRITLRPVANTLGTKASLSMDSDPQETIRGVSKDVETTREVLMPKPNIEEEARLLVGRVFCREYELGPDGQRKQGVPGRWHAVEGLRVELA